MQLSKTVKLYPTQEQKALVVGMMNEFIRVANGLVSLHLSGTSIERYTTKMVDSNLPSNIKGPCIRCAKSIVKKYEKELAKSERRKQNGVQNVKEPTVPIIKSPFFQIDNRKFNFDGENLKIPVRENGKVHRIAIKSSITPEQKKLFEGTKLGEPRIVFKGRKIVIQIPCEVAEDTIAEGGNVMGVDFGIKCSAVSYISNGRVKFYLSGRHNKRIRRFFSYFRRELQKTKRLAALEMMGDKERRIMKNIDHHLSHDIIAVAKANDVTVIKVEDLKGLRERVNKALKDGKKKMNKRTAAKIKRMVNTWPYSRVLQYVKYKAELAGIKVVVVDPAYTSQTCPKCGRLNKANDRTYVCQCGFRCHRDVVGAMNICNSTEIVEKGKTKKKRAAKADVA